MTRRDPQETAMPIDTPDAEDVLQSATIDFTPLIVTRLRTTACDADIAHRPQLPIHPELMGVDVEDETTIRGS